MTKKKKRQNPEIDELLARPWCYYCERDFDDLKILIHHQKAKHFKCERCARRLNTAGGLRVHMDQVHKETLEAVDNALPGRESVDLEIFGTEGIPESEVAAHNQRIMAEFAQKEADRRAASGQGGNGPKKPKIDISKELDPEEIKKKLEAHKKAMASGGATPLTPGPGASMSPGRSQSPGQFDNRPSPQVPPQVPYPQATSPPVFQQGPYPTPQNSYPQASYPPPSQGPYPTAFTQPAYQHQPLQPQPPAQFGRGAGPQVPFNNPPPPGSFGGPGFNGPPPPFQQGPPHQPQQQQQQRHSLPHAPSIPQPHQIPGLPPKPNVPGLPPRPSFAQPGGQGAPGFGRGGGAPPPGAPGTWAQQPPPHHQQQPQHGFSPAVSSPPPGVGFGQTAPYGPPPGQSVPGYGFPAAQQQHPPPQPPPGYGPQGSPHPVATPGSHQNGFNSRNQTTAVAPSTAEGGARVDAPAPAPAAPEEKKETAPAVKPKRATKLVYEDNDMSPEEKRAQLPRYAVTPPKVTVETAA